MNFGPLLYLPKVHLISRLTSLHRREYSINETCLRCIALRKQRTRNRPPWFNRQIEKLVKNKRDVWHSNRRTHWRNTALIAENKLARNELKKRIRRAIGSYENEIAGDKRNPRRFFAYVNSKNQSSRSGISAITDPHGVTHTNSDKIANVLNIHFSSVFTRDSNKSSLPQFAQRTFSKALDDVRFSEFDVRSRLERLDRNMSPGVDGVSAYVLRECVDFFLTPLTLLFNMSIGEGALLRAWLEANVTQLHKKGSWLDPSNYRLISLTSIVCKLMESIVRTNLICHLQVNGLISKHQHGFVPGRSCTTNLLEIIDFTTYHMSKKTPVDIVFLDFAKAFDKVSHRFLLH